MSRPTREKVSLATSDWDDLFPRQEYQLANSAISIYPLSLDEISKVMAKLKAVSAKLADVIQEKQEANNVLELLDYITIILQESPEILSDMSGIIVDDIKSLPLDESVALFSFCLDVNINSQESLVKNFKGLAEKVQKFTTATI